MGYKYKIEYIKSNEMQADALSRLPNNVNELGNDFAYHQINFLLK